MWRDSLPTASQSDTKQTQDEIGMAWRTFEAACPGFEVK